MMAKRVVGPSPPEPDWDRLDLRGVNSTRNAWGYLAADDSAIVSDDGKVYIRVEKEMLEKSGKSTLLRLPTVRWSVLKRCLRWSRIIKQLYEFEEDTKQMLTQSSQKNTLEVQNLKIRPMEGKEKLYMRRRK